MVEKTVRFYDTVLIGPQGERNRVRLDFWTRILDLFEERDARDRSTKVEQVDYLARAVSPPRPSIRHLQLDRIRDLTEQLNRLNLGNGTVAPPNFEDPNDRVSEPTFIVPFGSRGRLAIMSPAVQGTRAETIGRYLTLVLGLSTQGFSVDLVPVADPEILAKIDNADGAVMLEVHVDAGATIPARGGGAVGDAFRSAEQQSLRSTELYMKWSLGHSNGDASVRNALKAGARWVATNTFSRSAKVKLASFDQEGNFKRDELRALFDDRIVAKVHFDTIAGQRASDEDILTAIGRAISEFNAGRFPASPTSGEASPNLV